MTRGEVAESSRQVVTRYFQTWNTGDTSIASEVLLPDWVDHAHPEVTGPRSVRHAVNQVRAAQPNLHFDIEAILGDGDLVAVVGAAGQRPASATTTRLVWLVRLQDGQMVEMWTYRDTTT
jgi:ketosteroid isomerase-like protein